VGSADFQEMPVNCVGVL